MTRVTERPESRRAGRLAAGRQGSAILVGVVVLGALMVSMAAFMTRLDSQTRRVAALKRNVQALFMANEGLEALRRQYEKNGRPDATLAVTRPYGQVTGLSEPTSPSGRGYLAFTRGGCEGSFVAAMATLRIQGSKALVENKLVFYASHEIEQAGVRAVLRENLKTAYQELKQTAETDRELESQGKLAESYRAFLSETGLSTEDTGAVLKELEQ